MPDSPLVIPYDVEGVIVDVLKRRHPEHLAKAERLRGVSPRTYQTLKTVVRMSDAQSLRLSGDTTPALLLGIIGAPEFERNESEGIDAVFQLGMQLTVQGQRRRDVIEKRDVLAFTAIECMYQRLPRGNVPGKISSVRLTDYEPLADSDTQRTVGDARMIWEIGIANVLSLTGYLPADDSMWPPEGGGAPEDPYTPPEDLPQANPQFTLDRRPIVE